MDARSFKYVPFSHTHTHPYMYIHMHTHTSMDVHTHTTYMYIHTHETNFRMRLVKSLLLMRIPPWVKKFLRPQKSDTPPPPLLFPPHRICFAVPIVIFFLCTEKTVFPVYCTHLRSEVCLFWENTVIHIEDFGSSFRGNKSKVCVYMHVHQDLCALAPWNVLCTCIHTLAHKCVYVCVWLCVWLYVCV